MSATGSNAAQPDADALCQAIDRYPTSVREGTDPLVALYWWRRQGGDDSGFAAAVQQLLREGLVEILHNPEMALRLSAGGFAQLQAQLAADAADAAPAEEIEEEDAQDAPSPWSAPAADAVSTTPPAELRDALIAILRVLGRRGDRSYPASTLARIWALDGRRGGDLRSALDLMLAAGEVSVEHGERTRFSLTDRGRAALGWPAPC